MTTAAVEARARRVTERVPPSSALRRDEMLAELRLLVEALDRRVPRLERLGEAQIVGDAAELRRKAIALIAEMKSAESEG
jgi:hypothetical protein